jgi:hypothetical protein
MFRATCANFFAEVCARIAGSAARAPSSLWRSQLNAGTFRRTESNMPGLFRKKPKPEFDEIREALFGDVPLSDWRARDGGDAAEPWCSFESARLALAQGDSTGATAVLRRVTNLRELEARQDLQAWHFLRQLGVRPDPNEAKRVRGVVLEVHLQSGLDTLAAYSDHTARYINHGGRLIVWESPDDSIARLIDDLLRAGQRVADLIGPWEERRRPAPPKGHVRLNMLTPSGLHFGEGALDALSVDPMGGPVIAAGTILMKALIERVTATTA